MQSVKYECPTALARCRAVLMVAAAATVPFAAVLGSTLLPAQAQFTRFTGITDFGDSYADTGSAPGGAFRLGGYTGCPVGPIALGFPTCRFTGGTNFVDALQSIYGLPAATNYAIGGARTVNSNTIGALTQGFPYELAQFAASGTRLTPSDLVVLSVGGNDLSLVPSTATIAQANGLASISASRAVGGVQQLVAAGARNIAWLSPGNTLYFPDPPSGSDGLPLSAAQRTAWANTYFQQLQQSLAPLANSGVRIFLFDFQTLQARIAANPGQYGFASAGGCQAILGASNCLNSSAAVQNSFFYFNNVHPTSAAMTLIGRYMANQIDAPLTVVPQGGIVAGLAASFAASTFDRLDAYRTFQGLATAAAMPTKAPAPATPASPWSIYGEVNYATGGRDPQSFAAGYDDAAIGGTLGIEYRVDPRLRVGAVFGYSAPGVNLDVQNADAQIKSYQFAGYASFTDLNWFADALVAYGLHDFALDRAGIIDVIHADTGADTLTVAGQAGYLVDVGPVRAGPIAGLNYTHTVIGGYTETGDSLLTMMVGRQSLDTLTGDAGVQLRFPFMLRGDVYSPFVNVTADQDFLGSGRTVTTTQVTTPLLPVLTDAADNGRTYGMVAAGIAATIAGNLSATVNAATTFARAGGNDITVSSGIKLSF